MIPKLITDKQQYYACAYAHMVSHAIVQKVFKTHVIHWMMFLKYILQTIIKLEQTFNSVLLKVLKRPTYMSSSLKGFSCFFLFFSCFPSLLFSNTTAIRNHKEIQKYKAVFTCMSTHTCMHTQIMVIMSVHNQLYLSSSTDRTTALSVSSKLEDSLCLILA